eukprot:CAMPEP_0184644996 /NCGR_PEP_ID=MMETSP0308-20130426/1577_1 /TAXON_ID=38269 /ORGANISM="Gloeochaete witrockiana, Strain SAG 46.84" /LENGTH=327 /DNA_ID=CAMNT_0027073777 /DNA_START=59 /DNA_END=1042 /DNA_ORIENTATION=+
MGEPTAAFSLLELIRSGGSVEKIKRLLADQPSLISYTDDKLWTPLHIAATSSVDGRTVEVLLQYKADPNARNYSGDTALHWACFSGNESSAWLILANGGDLNARGHYANTPLHLAAANNHCAVVDILMQHGADLFAKNAYGNMPVMLATNPNIASMLKQAASAKCCVQCNTAFTATNARIQCFFCKKQFCDKCASREMIVERERRWPLRTCQKCLVTVRGEELEARVERQKREEEERHRREEETRMALEKEEAERRAIEEEEHLRLEMEEAQQRAILEKARLEEEEKERERLMEEERKRLEEEQRRKKKKGKKSKSASPPKNRPKGK